MADGACRQAFDYLATGKRISNKAQAPLGMKPAAVKRDDAGGFLTAVLKCVQSSAVMAAASGWPKMPKTPHSSRSVSPSRSESSRSSLPDRAAGYRLLRFGVVGRALLAVHRASLLTSYHRAAVSRSAF